MERTDGSLRTYLECAQLTYNQRKWLIYQITCGLKYTAELCICHHNLKVKEERVSYNVAW